LLAASRGASDPRAGFRLRRLEPLVGDPGFRLLVRDPFSGAFTVRTRRLTREIRPGARFGPPRGGRIPGDGYPLLLSELNHTGFAACFPALAADLSQILGYSGIWGHSSAFSILLILKLFSKNLKLFVHKVFAFTVDSAQADSA
jgi:hypothetical protein